MPEILVLSEPFSGLTGKISEPLALVLDEDEVDQQEAFSCGPQQDISRKCICFVLFTVTITIIADSTSASTFLCTLNTEF